jgi:hypothetical protein
MASYMKLTGGTLKKAMRRNPEGRTVPHYDPSVLLLTAEDCV